MFLLLLLLIPLALALVVLSVLGLVGFGPLTDERRAGRDGLVRAVGPAIGLMVGIGVMGLAVLATFVGLGVSGGEEDDDERRPGPPAAVATTTTSTTSTTIARESSARPEPRRATLGPNVTIEADEGATFPASYDVADRLESDTVLQVHVLGFEPFSRAVAEQCAVTGRIHCDNQIPVQLDRGGEARFQYLVSADVLDGQPVPGRCRAEAAPCTVVVRAVDGNARGEIQTTFGDAIPRPGSIAVTRTTGISLDGERVTVRVRNYPPGAKVTAMLCAAPDATGARCGAPGPSAPLLVGTDGSGTTELVIEPGRVGSDRVPCSRGDDCGISVASDDVFARAPVVPITFAAPPGAAYDPTRLALGLVLAAILVAIAAGLIIRTDWSAVGEAAAPEIDFAEYADLDAIIAALPPEEDDELVTSR